MRTVLSGSIEDMVFVPAYQSLSGSFSQKRQRALKSLEDCRMCPRDCGVNRLENRWAACKTGRYAVVDCYFAHFGEEQCLRGWRGSGTIFFSHCNLRCVFCQNYDISQAVAPGRAVPGSSPEAIAGMMLELQTKGCHNINFVYNTSAYDALDSIELMEGIVDIYMPDFKFWSAERSKLYMKAENYPDAAQEAIVAMHRQVGDLVIGDDGLARRGVLIRHLVMPGMLDETSAILQWIAAELGTNTYINLMDQYRPAGKVGPAQYVEINRRTLSSEFLEAKRIAWSLGFHRLDDGS